MEINRRHLLAEAPTSSLVIDVNYTVWGVSARPSWSPVMLGYGWAQALGVVVAAINALMNLAFVSAYPTRTILAVGFDLLAIYALTVHGGEAKALRIPPR
jgi:hypothetical protein